MDGQAIRSCDLLGGPGPEDQIGKVGSSAQTYSCPPIRVLGGGQSWTLVRDSLASCGWPLALQETLAPCSPNSVFVSAGISQLATASGSQDVCRKDGGGRAGGASSGGHSRQGYSPGLTTGAPFVLGHLPRFLSLWPTLPHQHPGISAHSVETHVPASSPSLARRYHQQEG